MSSSKFVDLCSMFHVLCFMFEIRDVPKMCNVKNVLLNEA